MTLAQFLNIPRLMRLGGGDYLVSELRLRDIAYLEAWAEARHADPMEAVRRDVADAADDEARMGVLLRAYDAVEAGPPGWGDGRFDDLLRTPEGIVQFLLVALSRHRPGLTADEAADLAARIEPEEFAALRRVCYGVRATEEWEWLANPGHAGEVPMRWPRWYVEACGHAPGLTLEAFGELTWTQLHRLRAAGHESEPGVPIEPGEDIAEVARRQREKYRKAMGLN